MSDRRSRADALEAVDVVGSPLQAISRSDPFSSTRMAPAKGTVMSKYYAPRRSQHLRAELTAEIQENHEDDLFDAIIAAAALMARADGRVLEVERDHLLEFLDRQDLLWMRDRDETLAQFESYVHKLHDPDESGAAFSWLRRYRDSRAAALILNVCDEVAGADHNLDPREVQLLRLIRAGLGGAPSRRAH
ncbi:TerB family tellurite resistance protein [Rhodoblastus acidophilus]|nr:TerB family tellurite resistance protein [Rhodoblastus acidophilus]RAI17533.1 TerB family tellurite resistance protein [Rhodoblastus acidophilus]